MALIETLNDDFSLSNAIDTSKWSIFNGAGTNVFNIDNQLKMFTAVSAAGSYYGITSLTTYDLTGSYFQGRLVNSGDTSIASYQTDFLIQLDSNNRAYWSRTGTTLACWKAIGGVYTQQGSSLTYDAAVHKYVRIRESSGTVYWDYSTDGSLWTNQTSIAVASLWAVTSISGQVEVGTNSSEASFTFAIWDEINIITGGKIPVFRYVKVGDGMSRNEGAT